MTKGTLVVLHQVCFGAWRCRGNEVWLHSHLGKCFAGNYGINKNRYYVFGQCFVWVTGCYPVKFLLSYKGGNTVILRLRMRLTCWGVDIIHQPDSELVDANYWSCLSIDVDFDSPFCDYLQCIMDLRKSHATPTNLPMHPENMPYYCGPCIQPVTDAPETTDDLHIQSLNTDIVILPSTGNTALHNAPVCFGHMDSPSCS